MFTDAWKDIACDRDLGGAEFRVLLFCVSTAIGPENVIPDRQRVIAERTGLAPATVSRAVKLLVEKGFILKDGYTFRVNSRLCADQSPADLIRLRKDEVRFLIAEDGDA